MTTPFDGSYAAFNFGGTTYRCLTNYNWNGQVQEAVERCSSATGAQTQRVAGAPEDVFTFDVILDAEDVTTLNALKRGQTGAFEFHPEDDVADNIEFTATSALVSRSSLAGAPGRISILSISMGIIGDLTIQAAV